MLVAAGALTPVRQLWFVQLLLIGWLLFAPGRLVLTALRVRPIQVRRFPPYTVAMSLLVVMLTGAAVDGIGVAVGDSRPLTAGPLWTGVAVTYVSLVVLAAAAPRQIRPDFTQLPSPAAHWVLLLPLLAAAGALRLNAGSGPRIALLAMVALVALWVLRPLVPGFTWRSASITVYAVSLAGLWSFSLRGDSVYGYDIITEHFIAQHTSSLGVWHLSHANDAYGALLSVTVLPATLHSVAGISVLAVFKVLFPAVFASVPVAILRLAGRLVGLPWAYVAVGVVIGQAFFFDSMPAVARQEIAFVFFVSLVAALIEGVGKSRAALIVLAAVGMVVSHYSSTYMAVALTGAALTFALLARAAKRRSPLAGIAIAFIVLMGGSFIWYHILTHSASNVGGVTEAFREHGFNLLPNRGSNPVATIVLGNVAEPLSAARYAAQVARLYATQYPFVHPLAQARGYPLQSLKPLYAGGATAELDGLVLSVISVLVNLLAAVGAILLALAGRRRATLRSVGLLGLGVLGFLIVIRLSGTAAVSYNQERAQIQAFVILAPSAVWVLYRARARRFASARRRRGPQVRGRKSRMLGAASLCSAVLVASAVGLAREHPSNNGSANVSANGEDSARFVLSAEDLAAAKWLTAAESGHGPVYADGYGRLRLLATRGTLLDILSDVTPRTLSRGAWIYEYSDNVENDDARSTLALNTIRYRFPDAFVNKFYDRVYTNGTAEVFHQ